MKTVKISTKPIKLFIKTNQKRYIFGLFFIAVGFAVGVICNLSEVSDFSIFSTNTVSLTEIITKEYKWTTLMWENMGKLLLASVILLVFSLKMFAFFLDFVYLGYQGFLLGVSISSVIMLNGFSGALSTLFFLLPINLLNFFAIVSIFVIFWNRLNFNRKYNVGITKSFTPYLKSISVVLCIFLLTSLVYSVVYPALLRTVIVINY